MKSAIGRIRRLTAVVAMACAIPAGYAQSFSWTTIVNNADIAPGTTVNFFSYNQPSVNAAGQVVFRARAKPVMGVVETAIAQAAAEEMMVSGVFRRDMSTLGPISAVAKRKDTVPQPNNSLTNGVLADFTEFPSTPRIDASSSLVATRGQSKPVYSYVIDALGSETRVGTSGVYADAGGGLVTGVGLLGAVRDFATGMLTFPYFSVPGAPEGTRFDQFPGSPAVTDGTKIAWKGNYTDPTDGLGRTGVYFRDVLANGGTSPVTLIANSNMLIPNQPAGGAVKFGSTAPPSAANGYVVFTGLDIEDAPTLGGIYRAPLMSEPPLQVLAGIGDPVPGENGATFNRFGEGLSISSDGRYVSFWGAWGTEYRTRMLYCVDDGNKERVAYCKATHPEGYPAQVPVNQGIFVADAMTGNIIPVAKAGSEGISDFVYWVYSGSPPGVGNPGDESGDETKEPPRWRSSAFSALAGNSKSSYGTPGTHFQIAFKATRNGVDGIYLRQGHMSAPLITVVETLMSQGQSIDPSAPENSIVTAVGIERDGFRHDKLAIAVSMLYETVDTSIGWAGLYLVRVPALTTRGDVNGDLKADLFWRDLPPGTGLSWWIMNGDQVTSTNYFQVDSAWQVADVGDFDGDGKSDIVWRHMGGATYIWLLDGLAPVGFHDVGLVSTEWSLVAAEDFNGDGMADLFWRRDNGDLYFFFMNGGRIESTGSPGNIGVEWIPADVADFDGDRKADIVWRNRYSGDVVIWLMDGMTPKSATQVASVDPTLYSLEGAGDFNGDGKADLLWRGKNGDIIVWLMDGTQYLSGGWISNPGTAWHVASLGDMDGDGKTDIVLHHDTFLSYIWFMDGLSIARGGALPNPGGTLGNRGAVAASSAL